MLLVVYSFEDRLSLPYRVQPFPAEQVLIRRLREVQELASLGSAPVGTAQSGMETLRLSRNVGGHPSLTSRP